MLTLLRLNGRIIDLQSGSVTDDAGHSISLRPQTAKVLKVLTAKPGEIVSQDELMQAVWGNIAVTDDSVVQCVIEIRKALGDDKHQIVRTLRKRGYVLEVKAIDESRNDIGKYLITHRRGSWIGLAAGLGVLIMAAAAYFWPVPESEADRPTIAGLPFKNINRDWPASSTTWPRANASKSRRWKSTSSWLGGKSTHSGAACKRPAVLTEEALHRELAARRELDAMRRTAYRAGAQVRAIGDAKAAQARAFEKQRQRADRLIGELALAQREVQRLKAEAVRAREAAEASLTEAMRAFDKKRQKVGLLERDLAAARQSIDGLQASAKVTAAAQAAATQRRRAAGVAPMRAGEALALERNGTQSLARELDNAREERDAAKDEMTRVSTVLRGALEQERDRTIGFARQLTAAREEIDILRTRTVRVKHTPKARATDSASRPATASVRVVAQPARQSRSREVRTAEVRKPSRPVQFTPVTLPAALLPTE